MKRKRLRYSRRKIFVGLFLFLFVLGIGIGYALVNTDLEMLGIAKVKDAKWDIHFDNYALLDGSIVPGTSPTITDSSISFSARVNEPGDFYGFTIDVENEGTINAILNSFSITPDFSSVDYVDATVSYVDGGSINSGDILPAGRTKTIKVLLEYKDGLSDSDYPTTVQNFNVSLSFGYGQYDGIEANFETDSWDDIIVAYNLNKTSNLDLAMKAGTTREVELDLDHDPSTPATVAHLRIANISKPSDCNGLGFSQTACGLVIEFADVIEAHRMNPYVSSGSVDGDGNKGGWELSDMRAYLNGDKYLEDDPDEIDYSNVGVIDALPSDLRNSIIITTVVSGHGSNDTQDFVTVDKLYLLTPKEVYNAQSIHNSSTDTAEGLTRQLDYYREKGVTNVYTSPVAIKKAGQTAADWWLRAPVVGYSGLFTRVDPNGKMDNMYSNNETSIFVSPAFRIAE